MDKQLLKDISYGMYIVTTKDDKNVGCVINTLTQVTSNDIMVSICLNKNNYTNQVIKKTKRFSVSIISEECSKELISTFGFKSSKDYDKFKEISFEEIDNLPVVNKDMCGYLICDVVSITDASSHDIILARVKTCHKLGEDTPMTYKYYQEVVKGKSPKNAPTYIEEKQTKTDEEQWVCEICGYVHKGPLPKDFVCPVCGVAASNFKKVL